MTKKEKILLLSPHLDDAVFSVGAIAAELAAQGHEVHVLTCFTKSVVNPTGFGLACVLDKNLPADVDYMELRRQEDQKACQLLGVVPHWGDLLEAPHRGYESAAELFQKIKKQDKIAEKLLEMTEKWVEENRPEIIFSPKGIGNHVDHQQVCIAVKSLQKKWPEISYFEWYDQPYLMRNPNNLSEKPTVKNKISIEKLKQFSAKNSGKLAEPCLPAGSNGLKSVVFDLKSVKMLKFQACAAYETQVNFQFGSVEKLSAFFQNSAEGEKEFLEILTFD